MPIKISPKKILLCLLILTPAFKHYSSTPCAAPCAERLWFENHLDTELEVWSVELDRHGHVVNKNYLISL
mgnify:CR=1 FL=1|jgi:hypothetical protein